MPILPIVYRKSGEGAIASYPFSDVLEGPGVVTFYGSDTYQEGAYGYVGSTTQVYSNNKITSATATGTGAETLIDRDFDVAFVTPKILKGTIYATISWISGHTTTANKRGQTYVDFNVYHYDGTTETLLGNATSANHIVASQICAGTTKFVKVPITTARQFKKGDTLRLNVMLMQTSGGASLQEVDLCHDPQGRTITTTGAGSAVDTAPDTTKMIFYVPFQIDT